ncbi:MAG: nucleotide sugar dehydrogenase [Bacillota bacterium]
MMQGKELAVFGLGFVGLPLALSFALRGHPVIGVDVNQRLVDALNSGVTDHLESYQGIGIQQILREQLETGMFLATTDASAALEQATKIVVTVGLPVQNGDIHYGSLMGAVMDIGRGLKANDLVMVRSTVVPGTTEEIIRPALERESGLRAGEDFFLAYSSERIAEGRAFEEFENMPAVLAGINEASASRARELLEVITRASITVASNIKVVETAKVVENISRDVNIALVNELARFCEGEGLDVAELVKVSNTHKRVNLLMPGPGVGGYCIPNAFYYLQPAAHEVGVELKLLETARKVNDGVPGVVVGLVRRGLEVAGRNLKGSRVVVLGLAMKDFSSDDRLSPALEVIKLLEEAGATVKAYDPAVPKGNQCQVACREEALEGAHAVVVLACQAGIDYNDFEGMYSMMDHSRPPVLVDTRFVVNIEAAREAGFVALSI